MMPIAAGAGHVGAAAGREVELLDVDQAQPPSRVDSLRSGSCGGLSASAKRIATGRSSQTIRFASCSTRAISAAETLAGRSIVDEAEPRWKLSVRTLQQAIERGRQHVLPGVLLHVLEAPLPVESSRARRPAGARARPRGRFVPSSLDDLDTRPRRACPCRTAGRRGRVERRAVEHDGRPARRRGAAEARRARRTRSTYGSV